MEVWKDIIGYEGIYQISNIGRVRSMDREQNNKNGRTVRYKGKILKQTPNSRGYMRVPLKSTQDARQAFVHRLVAIHFVPNDAPNEFTIVNHLDSNFLNNNADNLEWTTLRGNSQHALLKGRTKRTEEWLNNLHRSQEKYYKPVVGYDPLTSKEVVFFKSINEGGKSGYEASCICDCCKGKRKTHRKLAWRYAE